MGKDFCRGRFLSSAPWEAGQVGAWVTTRHCHASHRFGASSVSLSAHCVLQGKSRQTLMCGGRKEQFLGIQRWNTGVLGGWSGRWRLSFLPAYYLPGRRRRHSWPCNAFARMGVWVGWAGMLTHHYTRSRTLYSRPKGAGEQGACLPSSKR